MATFTLPTNFAVLAITSGGAVTAGTVSDKTGYSISGTTTTLDALQTALSTSHGSGSWATATGFSTLDAAGVRTAVGLASANLDTQLALRTGYKLASDGFDAVVIEASVTAGTGLINDTGTQLTSINGRQALAVVLSACGAILAGAASPTVTIKPAAKPTANPRITATVDTDGNRTAINLRVPD